MCSFVTDIFSTHKLAAHGYRTLRQSPGRGRRDEVRQLHEPRKDEPLRRRFGPESAAAPSGSAVCGAESWKRGGLGKCTARSTQVYTCMFMLVFLRGRFWRTASALSSRISQGAVKEEFGSTLGAGVTKSDNLIEPWEK